MPSPSGRPLPKQTSLPHRPLLSGLLAFFWLLAIVLLYYVSHKPFTGTTAVALGTALWRMSIGVLLFSLGGGLGRWLIGRWNVLADIPSLTRTALEAGAGLGVFSLLLLGLGSGLGLPGWFLWIAVFLPVILLYRPVLGWWKDLGALRGLWRESPAVSQILAAMLGLLLFFSLLLALSPAIHFDSLVSHLVMPDAYLRQEKITYLPWLFMTGMPQLIEVLYLPAIHLAGNPAAALLGWGFALFSALGLLGYLHQRFTAAAAWVGITALFAGYSLVMATANAYVDWPGLFYGMGALVCLDYWRQKEDRRLLLLSGLFIGFALGTKYTTGVLALALAAALAWHCWRTRRRFFPHLFALALPALVVFLPWLLKNLLSTGNPIYPLLFPAGEMTPLRLQGYQGLPAWGTWLDIVFLPLRATYRGIEAASGYGQAIGPLLLGLGALAWLGSPQRPLPQKIAVQNAAATALTGILLWALGNQFSGFMLQTRYYYTLFPAFTVLAAAGFDGLTHLKLPAIRLERLAYALILLVSALNLLQVSTDVLHSGAPQTVLGLQTNQSYLTQALGWYYPVMQHVQQMPAEDQVLLFFEPRSLYCSPRCAPDELMDRWKRDWNAYQDINQIKAAWQAQGFTHFLYYQTGATLMRETHAIQYTAAEWTALDRFLASCPPPLNFDDVYLLYSLP